MITALFKFLIVLLNLYAWAVALAAAMSMLISFGVLDSRNRLVWTVGDFLYRITEPVLRPIRNLLPDLGGIDISPLIVVLAIWMLIIPILARIPEAIVYGTWQPLFF